MDTQDIPSIRNRDKRFEELFVDCYGQSEEIAAMEVYFTDAVKYPFEAEWRDPDESGHIETVTVLQVADVDERRGVLLIVQRANGKQRRVVAEQLWARDKKSANAIVLDDYRHWVGELNGLTPGFGQATSDVTVVTFCVTTGASASITVGSRMVTIPVIGTVVPNPGTSSSLTAGIAFLKVVPTSFLICRISQFLRLA